MSEEQSGTQEFLQRLIKQRTAAADDLESQKRKRQAVLDVAEEARGKDAALTDDEDAEFRALTADIKLKGAEVKALDERIAELSEEIERSGVLSEGMKRLRKATSMIESVHEKVTYQKGDPRRSYLKDMCTIAIPGATGADEARPTFERHAHDVATLKEYAEERHQRHSGHRWLRDPAGVAHGSVHCSGACWAARRRTLFRTSSSPRAPTASTSRSWRLVRPRRFRPPRTPRCLKPT